VREAVEDAAPGTVIYVHEGTYNAYSCVSPCICPWDYYVLNRVDIVDKNNITLIGDGWNTVLNSNFPCTHDGRWKIPLINIINSSNITIMNLALIESGIEHELIHIENSRDITIDNCKIRSTRGILIAYSLINTPVVIIKNSTYCRFSNNLIYSIEGYDSNHMTHNYGTNPAIFLDSHSSNNLFFDNTFCKVLRGIRVEGNHNKMYHNNFYREHALDYLQLRKYWNSASLRNWTENKVSPIVSDAGSGNLWDSNYWGEHFVVANFDMYLNGATRTKNFSGVWRSCYPRKDNNSDGIYDKWYASPDPVYGNPVIDHYPAIEPFNTELDASIEGFVVPNRIYRGVNNSVYVLIRRKAGIGLINESKFNIMLLARKDGTWYEISNTTLHIGGIFEGFDVSKRSVLLWKPEDAGEYEIKARITSDIEDINAPNNEFAVKVEVDDAPSFVRSLREQWRPPDVKKPRRNAISPAIAVMAAFARGSDSQRYGWFDDRSGQWVKDSLRYGAEISLRSAGEWAARTMSVVASGGRPHDFAGINFIGATERFYNGANMSGYDVAWNDAYTLMALASTRRTFKSEIVENVTRDLVSKQHEDGHWEFVGAYMEGKASDTAVAVQALCAVRPFLNGPLRDAVDASIEKGLSYLRDVQKEDGSFSRFGDDPSAIATARVLQAFIAAGYNDGDSTVVSGASEYLSSSEQNIELERYLFFVNASIFVEELNNGTLNRTLPVLHSIFEDYHLEFTGNSSEVSVEVINASGTWKVKDEENRHIYMFRAGETEEFGRVIHIYEVLSGWNDLPVDEYNMRITALNGEPYPVAIEILRERPLPDLSVERVDAPAYAIEGANCTISAFVKNNGGVIPVTLIDSGKAVSRMQTGDVWAEGMKTVSFKWRPESAGPHNITVFADYFNEVEERDESNNAFSINIRVKHPDLVPLEMHAETSIVNLTNEVVVKIRGRTDERFSVALYDENDEKELQDMKEINGIGSENREGIVEVSLNWTPSHVGVHNLTVFVDCNDAVQESNENNNKLTKMMWVSSPDLNVREMRVPTIYANATNPIYVEIGGVARCFNVSLLICNISGGNGGNRTGIGNGVCDAWHLEDRQNLRAERADERFDVVLHWKPNRTGEYKVRVFVDSDNEVIERDETNNNETEFVNVVLPDLKPMNVVLPPHIFFNESNRIKLNISGAGDNFNVSMMINGSIENESEEIMRHVDTFYGNTTVEFNWIPGRIGTLNISFFVDCNDSMYESNETNNNLTVKVDVVERVPVEIIAPKGGERWKGVRKIRWSAPPFNRTLYINLWYSPDRGRRWFEVAHAIENRGEYSWDTRNVADGFDYKIKVEAYGEYAYGEAVSNTFMILNSGAEKSWSGFHTNAGFALTTTPKAPTLLWCSADVGAVPSSSLITVNNRIYAFCCDGTSGWVTCLDAEDGSMIWKSSPKGLWGYGSWLTPAFYNGKIYVPMRGTVILMKTEEASAEPKGSVPAVALHEIDANSGNSQVRYYLAGRANEDIGGVNGGALAACNSVFFGTYKNGTYYCYRVDGTNRYNFTGEYACRVAGVKDVDFVAVEDPGGMLGWKYSGGVSSWKSGEHAWSLKVSEGAAMSTPGAALGNLYLGSADYMGSSGGALYCVNPETGEEKWKHGFPSGVYSSITTVGGEVYLTTYGFYESTSGIYCVDAHEGSLIWNKEWQNNGRPTDSTPAYASFDEGSFVYIAGAGWGSDNYVTCFDVEESRSYGRGVIKWDLPSEGKEGNIKDEEGKWHRIGHWTNSPVVSIDKKVFAGEPGGGMVPDYAGLWCLDALTGELKWRTDYGGSTVAIVEGTIYTTGGGKVWAIGSLKKPDIVVDEIDAEEAGKKICGGIETHVNVWVKNVGDAPVNESFNVSLSYSCGGGYGGGTIGNETVDAPLEPGKRKAVEFRWIPPEVSQQTNCTLQAEANADRKAYESDLTNNMLTENVTVYPMMPDIELVKIDAPAHAEVGESCSIRVEVRNNGA
ncbi:MAG: PQQ-binding-like beta-propeller repeat protein, partial [Methanophagales archaeon]|nr:PQQ-binding-like beta-propeller repeat protein [Methanophagales archaeon]